MSIRRFQVLGCTWQAAAGTILCNTGGNLIFGVGLHCGTVSFHFLFYLHLTVAPPFSSASTTCSWPPDMHLPKESLLFSNSCGTVRSCDIRNGYSSCFHMRFWTSSSLFLEQPLMLCVYWLQSENRLATDDKHVRTGEMHSKLYRSYSDKTRWLSCLILFSTKCI